MAVQADNNFDVGSNLRRRVAQKLYEEINKEEHDETSREAEADVPRSPYTIQNVLWLLAAVAVFYFTDLPIAVLYDPRIYRTWLNVGIVLIGANIGIAAYLIIFLSWIKKVSSDDWESKHPAAIPIATGCFAFGSLCVTIGLWPVWGWFTPLVLFTELMAVVILISMLPNF